MGKKIMKAGSHRHKFIPLIYPFFILFTPLQFANIVTQCKQT